MERVRTPAAVEVRHFRAEYEAGQQRERGGGDYGQSLFHADSIAPARADSSVLPVKPRVVRCCQPLNVLRKCPDELVSRVPVALQLDGENLCLPLRLAAFGFRVAGQLNRDSHWSWG